MVFTMNMSNLSSGAASAWSDYKESNPLMLRGTVVMKDTLYRKNSPKKELWSKEISFDYDFYLLALAAGAAAAMLALSVRRACRRAGKRQRRKKR